MTATELDVVTISTRNPSDDGGDTVEWVTVDAVNGNRYRATGRETLLVTNTATEGALTFVISSVDDGFGRTLDVERLIEAGELVAFELGTEGWRDVDGYIQISGESDELTVCVIRRPAR